MKIENINKFKGDFFKVLGQTDLSQIAVMTIEPGKDSGPEEIHSGDQIVYIVEGTAKVEINKEVSEMKKGDVAIIPKGAQHHIYNSGNEDLFFLTMYSPPQY